MSMIDFNLSSLVHAGIGLNVNNEEPTTCLNAVLRKLSDSTYQFRREDVIAAFFNKFETFYDTFINQGESMLQLAVMHLYSQK